MQYSFSLLSLHAAVPATETLPKAHQQKEKQPTQPKKTPVTLILHTANAHPAGHPTLTDTAGNADIPTSIRDGLERNTEQKNAAQLAKFQP